MNNCIKCGNIIDITWYMSDKYCSKKCQKNYLKAEYKKRNREKLNAYNRQYRARNIKGHPSDNKQIEKFAKRNQFCAKCGTTKDLEVCHVIPRNIAKNHDSLIRLCRKHHYQFDNTLVNFWTESEAK